MARFQYSDETIRAEVRYILSKIVWGAVKDWQGASADRPQMTKAEIDTICDDYLFETTIPADCEALVNKFVNEILARADRAGAAVYL